MTGAAIQLDEFSYRFGERTVLDDVSLSISSGASVSIVGGNGAGKSTLLRCMLGLPLGGVPSGESRLFDMCPFRGSRFATARLAAYMPQSVSGPQPFTVFEYVRLSRFPHESCFMGSRGSDEAPVRAALAEVGMEAALHRSIDALSGGERQKVLLAAALAQETPILLLDEPTTFLDPRFEAETARILRRVNRKEGRTVVTVTHDLNRAALQSDRVIALKQGRVVFDGASEAFLKEEVLYRVFDARFSLTPHPLTGVPWIVPAEP